jgi:hypothetical protein
VNARQFVVLFALVAAGANRSQVRSREGPHLTGPEGVPRVYVWPSRQQEHEFPIADSNSPLVWADGKLLMFASAGHAYFADGRTVWDISAKERSEWTPIRWNNEIDGGRWMEAVIRDDSGALYGWYHNEPGTRCAGDGKTAPLIGAGISNDSGRTWKDLGIVLAPPEGQLECLGTPNVFFNGGNGDESAILDENREWLYIFYSNYAGPLADQGISVARMKWSDRDSPQGRVFKYFHGTWDREAGVGGLGSPVFPATISWHDPAGRSDAFWGASIHWNTYLHAYVILMNRAEDSRFTQQGIYVSYSPDLTRPELWSRPVQVTGPTQWYPQVVGMPADMGTDKLAGRYATFKVGQLIRGTLQFGRPGETLACPPEGYPVRCRY